MDVGDHPANIFSTFEHHAASATTGANRAEIFAVENVDGALVGGASLKAEDFGGIIEALDKAKA